MPTLNPRVTVTLTPAVAAVLREMSELAGNSQSAIVGELLESSLPVFERVVTAMRAASTIRAAAKSEIAEGLERAQAKLEDQLGLMLEEMDHGTRPLLEAAERVQRRAATSGGGRKRSAAATVGAASGGLSTPVPVTRGSGGPFGASQGVSAPPSGGVASTTSGRTRKGVKGGGV